MPILETSPGVRLHYEVDDYTDLWTKPDCVLMLHGIGETANAWRAWAPHFARRYRVIRPDLRGFGQSGAIGAEPLDGVKSWADDIESLVAKLGCARVHVIGAKLGALIGMELARRQVPWMASMTIAGLLISPKKAIGPWAPEWMKHIKEKGMESWARLTMPGRMGGAISEEANEWWVKEMAATKPDSVTACLAMVSQVGEAEGLEKFTVPTLVIVSSGAAPAASASFDQRQPVDAVDKFRSRIPRSELFQIPTTSYHIAATHPDECAERTLRFVESHP
jgi:3-oxoadipate enol-lactonase